MKPFYDKFSLCHFAVGIIFRYFNISLMLSTILHIIFEIVENSELGIYIHHNYLPFWPGGKHAADGIINSTGDTVFFMLGWLVANALYR